MNNREETLKSILILHEMINLKVNPFRLLRSYEKYFKNVTLPATDPFTDLENPLLKYIF